MKQEQDERKFEFSPSRERMHSAVGVPELESGKFCPIQARVYLLIQKAPQTLEHLPLLHFMLCTRV